MAGGGAPRHYPGHVRAGNRRADAGPEHYGPARRSAGIHQIAMGLSRPPGRRRAHRPRPRAVGAIRQGLCRGRARLRRRSLHSRGDLGRRIEIRHHGRRSSGDPLDRNACLRRPPPRFFPRRVFVGAGHRPARRRAAPAADRLLGRRVRADPVHALDVRALRGRFRRRRPPRHCRFRPRRHRLDGEQSEKLRLGEGRGLGLRGRAAAALQLPACRPLEADDAPPMAGARCPAGGRQAILRGRPTGPISFCPPARAGLPF